MLSFVIGSSPYGSTRDRVVIENYQGRQNIYNQPSLHEYEPLLTDSPVVVQTGGLFNVSSHMIGFVILASKSNLVLFIIS